MNEGNCQHKGCHELGLMILTVSRYSGDPGDRYRFCAAHGNAIVSQIMDTIRPAEPPRTLR